MDDSAHFPTHNSVRGSRSYRREEPVLRQLIRTRSTRRSKPSRTLLFPCSGSHLPPSLRDDVRYFREPNTAVG